MPTGGGVCRNGTVLITMRNTVGDDHEMRTLQAMQSRAASDDLVRMGKYRRHIVGGDRGARLIREASQKFLQTGHMHIEAGKEWPSLKRSTPLVRSARARE